MNRKMNDVPILTRIDVAKAIAMQGHETMVKLMNSFAEQGLSHASMLASADYSEKASDAALCRKFVENLASRAVSLSLFAAKLRQAHAQAAAEPLLRTGWLTQADLEQVVATPYPQPPKVSQPGGQSHMNPALALSQQNEQRLLDENSALRVQLRETEERVTDLQKENKSLTMSMSRLASQVDSQTAQNEDLKRTLASFEQKLAAAPAPKPAQVPSGKKFYLHDLTPLDVKNIVDEIAGSHNARNIGIYAQPYYPDICVSERDIVARYGHTTPYKMTQYMIEEMASSNQITLDKFCCILRDVGLVYVSNKLRQQYGV